MVQLIDIPKLSTSYVESNYKVLLVCVCWSCPKRSPNLWLVNGILELISSWFIQFNTIVLELRTEFRIQIHLQSIRQFCGRSRLNRLLSSLRFYFVQPDTNKLGNVRVFHICVYLLRASYLGYDNIYSISLLVIYVIRYNLNDIIDFSSLLCKQYT